MYDLVLQFEVGRKKLAVTNHPGRSLPILDERCTLVNPAEIETSSCLMSAEWFPRTSESNRFLFLLSSFVPAHFRTYISAAEHIRPTVCTFRKSSQAISEQTDVALMDFHLLRVRGYLLARDCNVFWSKITYSAIRGRPCWETILQCFDSNRSAF